MKHNRRKLVRRSFMAVVTGTSAFALQACGSGDSEQGAAGNNAARQTQESGEGSDGDAG